MRHPVAVHQEVALLDVIAFLHADVLALRDQVLDRLLVVLGRRNDDAPLRLVVLAEFDAAVALADDREILRLARLEQFGDTRQTARDVTRLRGFARDARQDVAGLDVRPVVDRKDRVDRHEVARLEPVGQGEHLALLVAQRDPRPQIAAARLLLPVDDHFRRDAGRFVYRLAHRQAFDEVDVMRDTVLLGDDRDRVGVPLDQSVAPFDLGPIIDEQPGAVRNSVPGFLSPSFVQQHDFGVAAHYHRHTARVDHDVSVLHLRPGVKGGLDGRLLGAALRGTADVEGAHRQLRAGFADRLRGNDPDRLTDIDDRAARQVASVALAANADAGFAGQHRADRYGIDTRPLDLVDGILVDQCARREHDLAAQGIEDIDRCGTAENAVGEWGDDLAAVDDGARHEPARGAAIFLGDDRVLRDIDEPARQITRIRRLQRGVSEALAGAVRRVEVFEDGQPLLEVRDDRRLDDLARRLRHQAAHAGQLLDLRRRTARPGIRHHPHRVDRLAGLR